MVFELVSMCRVVCNRILTPFATLRAASLIGRVWTQAHLGSARNVFELRSYWLGLYALRKKDRLLAAMLASYDDRNKAESPASNWCGANANKESIGRDIPWFAFSVAMIMMEVIDTQQYSFRSTAEQKGDYGEQAL